MALDAVGIAQELFEILCEAKERWDQRKLNVRLSEELQRFVKDLQLNIEELEMKAADTCSNSSICALASLGEDLKRAHIDAKDILQKGFIRSIWDSKKTLSKIQALRERVMTSFQTRILFSTLDVSIEGQKGMDAFQASMLKINENLMEMYSTHNVSIKDVLRSELKLALQPMMAAMECKNEQIQAVTLLVGGTKAQTDDAEKFFADVLAELEQISRTSKREADGSSNDASRMESSNSVQPIDQWFEDPITFTLMCDPVKAVDGHTYDRWTIVQHGISKSPFSPGQVCAIATDDIDVRSRLFARFPDQEVEFHSKRAAYREKALEAADKGYFGDAVTMLGHVLQWDKEDKECQERRDQAMLEMEVGESILRAGQSLQAGASLRKGSYKLIMQADDNLVIYCENGGNVKPYATWSSKTFSKAGGNGKCYLTMQEDGNLVMYKGVSEKEVVWESNSQATFTTSSSSSSSESDYALHLKETGILEIRSSSGRVRHWSSKPMKTLMAGESLKAGSFLLNGAYKLGMQLDDNLVLYHLHANEREQVVWASGTMRVAGGTGTCRLVMQHDGNLVMYDGPGTAVWMSNSRTQLHCEYSLHLRSDGRLDIRSPDGHIKWRH